MKRNILTIALALILIPFVHGQDIKLKGTISAENNQIKNITDPTDAQDAATKSYVDTNVNSFSGSYNDLTDTPTTITTQQATDISTNTNKVTFPGFGTTAGTALEGDTALFSGSYTDLTDTPTTITTQQATDISTNTAKISFPGFGTTAGTALEGDTALFSGSYTDLTDTPTTYTQAEVDALIARLQSQIYTLLNTVKDQDGNRYPYITYGDQVWTVKNAEMVTYRDGTQIPQVTDATEWSNLSTGAWCYYNNDPTKGKLYNWYAVMGIHDTDPNTPNKEFAPNGWHVPTNDEWTTLEEHLIANGYNYDQTTSENKIAKAMASAIGWDVSSITGAPGNEQSLNNSSGFNALPEGNRYSDGSFDNEAIHAYFWSVTEYLSGFIFNRYIYVHNAALDTFYVSNLNGFSVRFVRD